MATTLGTRAPIRIRPPVQKDGGGNRSNTCASCMHGEFDIDGIGYCAFNGKPITKNSPRCENYDVPKSPD